MYKEAMCDYHRLADDFMNHRHLRLSVLRLKKFIIYRKQRDNISLF